MMECANSCTQNCVAINTYATSSKKGDCYHYTNRTGLVTANERQWDESRAYLKCLGKNECGHSCKLCDLQQRLPCNMCFSVDYIYDGYVINFSDDDDDDDYDDDDDDDDDEDSDGDGLPDDGNEFQAIMK